MFPGSELTIIRSKSLNSVVTSVSQVDRIISELGKYFLALETVCFVKVMWTGSYITIVTFLESIIYSLMH